MNEHIFEASKIYENISDASSQLLKRRVYFWTRRIHYGCVVEISYYISMLFRRVVHISDASRKTLNYSSIFPRRVENVPDASPKYATIFQCYFENYIYDPSARIIKNLLNSTVFWKGHLNPTTRPLNSATRQILH